MIEVSKEKIANYLSDEKGYAYKVAIGVAKDISEYINNKIKENRKEVTQELLTNLEDFIPKHVIRQWVNCGVLKVEE